MRERWARIVAMLTGGFVVALAVAFAWQQNPSSPMRAPADASPDRTLAPGQNGTVVVRGQEVYADLACARCHSIDGKGGGRSALGGVGRRLSEAEIRAWVTPDPARSDFQGRHAHIDIAPADREALVVYLRSLR